MPSSHTTSYRKLLRRAQGAVRTLKTAGHSTMALEVELKRGEQAIAHKHWAEAKEHLDMVLASTPAVRPPGRAAPVREEPEVEAHEAPHSFSDGERRQVADKLGLARDRLAILDQFGIATRDLLTSLQRADQLLDHGYTAQAETLADELLVMTKAAAEGLEAATHKTGVIARAAGNGTTAHHDFLAALRGTLADVVKTQGWLGETEVRTLVSEAMGPLARAGDVEARLHQLTQQIDAAATALRHDRTLDQEALAARLAELHGRLTAGWADGLASLRQDLDQAAAEARSATEQRDRLARTLARLEEALDTQRDATGRAQADLAVRLDVLAGQQDGVNQDLAALAQRCARITADHGGNQEHLQTLSAAMAATQAQIAALADQERAERVRLAGILDGLDRQLQALPAEREQERLRTDGSLHEHAQILIALESGLDGARTELAPLRGDLAALAQRLDKGLAELRSGIAGCADATDLQRLAEDLRQRLTASEQRLADDAARSGASSGALEERLTRLAADLEGLHASSAGLATLGTGLADARAELARLRDAAADHSGLEAVTGQVQDQARRIDTLEQDVGGRLDTLAMDAARTLAALDQALATTSRQALARLDDLDHRSTRLQDEVREQRQADADAARLRLDEAIAGLRRDLATLGASKADSARIDDLASRLEQALAHRQREDTERLTALGERLAQVDARAELVPADLLERTLTTLRAEFAAIAATKADHGEAGAPLALLAELRQELAAHLADLDQRLDDAAGRTDLAALRGELDRLAAGEADRLAGLDSTVTTLRQTLAEQASRMEGGASSAEVTALREQLAAATGRLHDEIATLAAAKADTPRLEALAATKADADQLARLAQRLDAALAEMRREDDKRLARLDDRTGLVPAEELARTVAALRDAIAAKADAPHVDALAATKADTAQLDVLAQRLEAALAERKREDAERLASLDERITRVDGRIDPAPLQRLDDTLAALRTECAAKADAAQLDTLAQRLEAALAERKREAGERLASLDERIARVDARIDPAPLQRLDDSLAALRTELAAKADGTRIDQMADSLAQLLATMRQEMDTRLAATDQRSDSTTEWQEHFNALATDLRTAIEQTIAGKVDTAWLDQVEAGLDRRLVQQEDALARIESALARRKTVDESTETDAATARLMVLEQEVASLGRDLLAKGRALDELRATPGPEARLAAIETALTERATLAQAEDAAQRAATMVPELSARIDSLALDLSDLRQQSHDSAAVAGLVDELKRELGGLRNLKEHVAETERRVADLARIEERLAVCETGLAATGGASATSQLPDRILQLITGSEAFHALVAREVAVARNFVSPHGEDTEQVHRSVSDLAQRMEHIQEQAAPAFAAELAVLRQRIDELAARGSAPAVDPKQLRDQVLESLRPLIPRSEKVVEVINAAVQAAVGRMQAPAAGAAAPDPKALRKLLPDLLTAPEIRSTIISTVLLEALSNKGSLGNLTGIRQLVHDELLHIIADHKAHLSGSRPPVAPPAGQNSGQRPATGH